MGSQARQIDHTAIEKPHKIDPLSILLALHYEAEPLLFEHIAQYCAYLQEYENWKNKLEQQLQKLSAKQRTNDIPGVEALLKLTQSGTNSPGIIKAETITNWHFKHRIELIRILAQQNASCLAVWPTLAVLLELEQNLEHYQQQIEYQYLAQRYNGFLHIVDTFHRHHEAQLEPACTLTHQQFSQTTHHRSQALSSLLNAQQQKAEFETIAHYSTWAAQALLRNQPPPAQLPLSIESLKHLSRLLKSAESEAVRFLQWRCWCYQNQWPRAFLVETEHFPNYAIDGSNPLFLELLTQVLIPQQQVSTPTFYRLQCVNNEV
jgi:hypothetical protein